MHLELRCALMRVKQKCPETAAGPPLHRLGRALGAIMRDLGRGKGSLLHRDGVWLKQNQPRGGSVGLGVGPGVWGSQIAPSPLSRLWRGFPWFTCALEAPLGLLNICFSSRAALDSPFLGVFSHIFCVFSDAGQAVRRPWAIPCPCLSFPGGGMGHWGCPVLLVGVTRR